MNLDDIKQFLEENKEDEAVKAFIGGFSSINEDDIKAYLENEDGKRLLQPKLDSYFTKGLETWQQNNLQKLIDEEVSKLNPDQTPEQKRIKELEDYVAQKERESLLQTNKNTALSHLNEKKLPSTLVDILISDDEAITMKNLSVFEEVFTNQLKQAVDEQVKERIGQSSYVPPTNNGIPSTINPFSKDTLNLTEQGRILREDPELAKTLKAQA